MSIDHLANDFRWDFTPLPTPAVPNMLFLYTVSLPYPTTSYILLLSALPRPLYSLISPQPPSFINNIHKLTNTVYTPPNAAMHGCHVFDPLTGERTHVAPTAYDSVMGVINPNA